jgi:drug/metabolite transporter (DMT)-like permease
MSTVPSAKKSYIAYVLLILTTLFWASNIVIGKALDVEITPLSLAFLRWSVASLIVLPLSLSMLRRDWPAIVTGWRMILLLSLLGVSLFNTILYFSTHTTAATNIALIQTAMPVFVVILSYLLFGQVITPGMLVGVILGVSGAVFVIFKGQLQTLQGLHLAVGDLSMVCATLLYALYSVLLPKAPRLHPLSFLAVTFVLGTLMLSPFFVWERVVSPPLELDPRLLLLIGYIALFPSVLAYLFWNHGVAVIGSNSTGLFACFIPVFTPMIAAQFLHETLHVYHAVGLVMIILGVLLVHAAKMRRSRIDAVVPEHEQ